MSTDTPKTEVKPDERRSNILDDEVAMAAVAKLKSLGITPEQVRAMWPDEVLLREGWEWYPSDMELETEDDVWWAREIGGTRTVQYIVGYDQHEVIADDWTPIDVIQSVISRASKRRSETTRTTLHGETIVVCVGDDTCQNDGCPRHGDTGEGPAT